jgi:hypothetical protein
MTLYNTLLLDRTEWDLVLDAQGNIAMASTPYALAQDVASAIKLFIGECYYDVTRGIPYWQNILGQFPTLTMVEDYMVKAALTVPGVVTARCIIGTFNDRVIEGTVEFIDENGVANNVQF